MIRKSPIARGTRNPDAVVCAFGNSSAKRFPSSNARTIGAQKAAEAAQAAAAKKVRQYEEALRQARAMVYAEQESDRRKLMDERAASLKDARGKADAEVTAAKERVAGEFAGAKKEIEGVISQLAAEITRRVLQAPPAPGSPTREAR